jgi:hypothetical protein
MSMLVTLLLGAALLVFGRKLFWLAGAAIGFLFAMSFARHFFPDASQTVSLVVALGFGLLGAALAFFLQKIAVWVIGFLVGGFLLMNIGHALGFDTSPYPLIAFILGGVLGGIIVHFLLDWALIILSSVAGAFLVVHALNLGRFLDSVVVLVLAVVGILIQSRLKRVKRAPKAPAAKQA